MTPVQIAKLATQMRDKAVEVSQFVDVVVIVCARGPGKEVAMATSKLTTAPARDILVDALQHMETGAVTMTPVKKG